MSIAARQQRLMTVIEGPHLSEKAHISAESNQVVLKVRKDATKREIAAAVELLFEVEVEDVTTVNVKGKSKRFGRTMGSPIALRLDNAAYTKDRSGWPDVMALEGTGEGTRAERVVDLG